MHTLNDASAPTLFLTGACAIIIALLHTAALSWKYIAPLLRNGSKEMLPIWTLTDLSDDDDYFYFARIQKIFGASPFNGDPLIMENAAKAHPHSTYQASLFFCGFLRLFTKNTMACFFAARLFYPALHFLLLSQTFLLATPSYGLAFFTALLVLDRGGTEYVRSRVPNILFTSVHLSMFFLCGYWYWTGTLGLPGSIAFAACIAVSPVISVLNGLFVFFSLGVLSLCSFSQLMGNPALVGTIIFFSLPIAAFALRGYRTFPTLLPYADSSDVYFSKRRFRLNITRQFGNRIAAVALLFLASIFLKKTDILYPVLICAGAASCMTFTYITQSRHAVSVLIERCLTHITTLAAIFAFLLFIAPYLATIEGLGTIDMLAALAAVCYAALLFKRKYAIPAPVFLDKDKKELTLWAETISKHEVIVSLDFFTSLSLPAYTHAWFYIPQLILSSANDDEVWERLYDVCALHKVSPKAFEDFTERLLPCASPRTPETLPYIAAGQYLTYYQYNNEMREKARYTRESYNEGIDFMSFVSNKIREAQKESPDHIARGWCLPPKVTAQRNRAYVDRLRELHGNSPLRFKATLVLFGTEAPLSGSLTRAEIERSGAVPLFCNTTYAVFSLEDTLCAAAITERETSHA